ncbi:MAG: (d)CMP kinase [Acholeplasmatales bacterium]|jgi:cytidylate kinase|nr:(d)CMP kinase [Acholeplasmatales bacterium]
MRGFHIAVDGPAGSGKSTICDIVAERLNIIHIDTGSMYRAITYLALEKKIDLNDEKSYGFVKDASIVYEENKIFANGIDVTEQIRSLEVTKNVSKVSSFPSVRKHLVKLQRKASKGKNVIMDGRDIGSVVLPNADLKIFLTANIEERAKRRMLELHAKGQDVDLLMMIEDIKIRDHKDSTRKASPLIIPKDAIIVDSTNYSIEETVEVIIKEILKRGDLSWEK